MRLATEKVLWILFLIVFFFSFTGLLHAQSGAIKSFTNEPSKSSTLPDLADLIPLAGDLAGRLAVLKNTLKQMPDVTLVSEDYAAFKTEVDSFEARLQQAKDSDNRRLSQLMKLSQELKEAQIRLEDIENPLSRNINHLASWNAEWLAEKEQWLDWELHLLTEQDSSQLKAAFSDARGTIDTALKLISQHLDTMLKIQIRNKSVRTRMAVLDAEVHNLIKVGRHDYLLTASPPMYSFEYFAQFRSKLWQAALENVRTISLPSRFYFAQHGWTFIAQFLLFIVIVFSIHRNREQLRASKRWQFLVARPFAAGFFIVIVTQLLIPENQRIPALVSFFFFGIFGGISFARILMILVKDSWQRRAILGVIALQLVSMAMNVINLPLPLLRLYILLVSLLALYFLVRSAVESHRQPDSALLTWGVRLGYILLGVIIVAQIRGKEGLASYLFSSTLTSLTVIFAFCLFVYILRGGLRWIFFSSPVWSIKQLRSEAELLSRRSGYLIEVLIVLFALLPILLTIWGVFGSASEATKKLLAFGFNIGSERISLDLLLVTIGILYGSFFLSWILPKVILDEKIAGANLERGVRISIGNLIKYFIILVGCILTLTSLGLDFTKLTIILSALGVGIGFGLQGLVNDFFSGLVLLFERPIRVGDNIEMDGKWAEIKKIGLRSTTVQTFDQADLIIPNADLITKVVTNWTLSNRQVRVSIEAGVAHGSDISKVMETLLGSATNHEKIVKSPSPEVLFTSFGASSLDFELRAWITDVDYMLSIKSELRQEIDRRFREENIEIAFPQLDVHMRSDDNHFIDKHSSDPEADEKSEDGKD